MRLPFLQVAQETLAKARMLGRYARIAEAHALGIAVMLDAWAVEMLDGSGVVQDPAPAEPLAAACGWDGDAEVLLAALLRSRIVEQTPDGGIRIPSRERYEAALAGQANRSEKARAAAKERWGRKTDAPSMPHASPEQCAGNAKTQTQTQTQKKEELPSSAAADLQVPLLQVAEKPSEQPEDLQALWNHEAHASLPRWQGMSDTRKRRAAARLREKPLQTWREVIRRLSASPFCRGEEGGTGWRASPDWLLQPEVADKVLEGQYDRPDARTPAQSARADTSAGRGGTQAECAGCGEQGECAGAGQGVLLGYACRCMGAWMNSGLDYTAAAEWARNRRAGRAA